MDLPAIIRERLIDLERRFSGPIPATERFQATLPTNDQTAELHEINQCIEYFAWLCASRSAQLRWTARWAIASRGQSGLTAIVDRERFQIACRRLRNARHARNAWLAARARHGNEIKPMMIG